MARFRATLRPEGYPGPALRPLRFHSPNLRDAVLAAEDDGFYTHPGFDIEAMLSALEYNRARSGIKRGASTISQQLAKNLFLTNEKTFETEIQGAWLHAPA